MPSEIYFYVVLNRNKQTHEWEMIDTRHYDTLEDAKRAINIRISCSFDDFFRYEISGDEKSRNVWDKEKSDWVYESRIELYRAMKAKI